MIASAEQNAHTAVVRKKYRELRYMYGMSVYSACTRYWTSTRQWTGAVCLPQHLGTLRVLHQTCVDNVNKKMSISVPNRIALKKVNEKGLLLKRVAG